MTFLRSSLNGCSYILSLDGANLMYHPMYKGGIVESNRGAYTYVEFDGLDPEVAEEASRCFALLSSDYQQDTPLADLYGG